MTDPSRRDVLKAVGVTGAAGSAIGAGALATSASDDGTGGKYPPEQPARDPPRAYENYTTYRVGDSGEYDTVQAAVNAADPESLVLVEPGVYREAVEVTDTPRLTIRGLDRNGVVLDGEFKREDGVLATVDDVVVENVTARNFARNGFFWSSVEGWRGSYLTAHNNRLYGIYSIDSMHGLFEDCYASGHTDSGFYVGQCEPCHARVENVVSENNAIGYSGTNAGGYLSVAGSTFRHNKGGIVPNSLDSEAHPPQDATHVANNLVEHNNNADAPDAAFGYAAYGTGILVAGGINDIVENNTVRGHVNFGIGAVPMVDENTYLPHDNVFRNNTVENSGRADLALGAPQGGNNEFRNNDAGSTRPAGLQGGGGLLEGDPWATMVLFEQFTQLDGGGAPKGEWQDAPEPPFDELDGMPDPGSAPPREAVRREEG